MKVIAFLVGVEIQSDDVSQDELLNRLSDALTHIDGVGRIDIQNLGEMQTEEESE